MANENNVNDYKCIKTVIEQIENMLYNNKENIEDITEHFIDWCENGAVFYNLTDKDLNAEQRITNKEKDLCIKYMERIAPLVDNLTEELYNMYFENEEE